MQILEQYRNIRQLKKTAKIALSKLYNYDEKRYKIYYIEKRGNNFYDVFYKDKETKYEMAFRLPLEEWLKDNGFYFYYNMRYFIEKVALYKKRCERGFYE